MDTLLKATTREFFEMLVSKRVTVSYASARDASRVAALLTLMRDLANEIPDLPEDIEPAKPGEGSINGVPLSYIQKLATRVRQPKPAPAVPSEQPDAKAGDTAKQSEPAGPKPIPVGLPSEYSPDAAGPE